MVSSTRFSRLCSSFAVFLLLLANAAFAIDPLTNATGSLNPQNYVFGTWAASAVSVSLACVPGTSDCASIAYCNDTANTCDPTTAGAEYIGAISITSEGTTYVRYASNNSTGGWGDVGSAMIRIDSSAPLIAISDNASLSWGKTDAIAVSASDALSGISGTKWVARNDGTCGSGQDGEIDSSGTNGTSLDANNETIYSGKYICFRATDAAGNRNYTVSAQITHLDTTAPSVNAGEDRKANSQFTQSATATDSASGISAYSWSGPGGVTFGSPNSASTNISASADGTHTISLAVTDAAGNIGTDSFALTWDASSPGITISNPGNATAPSKLLTAATSEGTLSMSITTGTACNSSLAFVAYAPLNFSSESDNGKRVCYKSVDEIGNAAYSLSLPIGGILTPKPNITINGEPVVTVEVHGQYNDSGASAYDNFDGNLTANITVASSVNTSSLGNYTVTYEVIDSHGVKAAATRVVSVVDTASPIIALIGNSTAKAETGSIYLDAGASASDNYDGDISANIVVKSMVDTAKAGTYLVTYDVEDSSGNKAAQVARTVEVADNILPFVIGGLFALALVGIVVVLAYLMFFKKRRGL